MSGRHAELLEFTQSDDGKARLIFRIPMRGLIGFRTELTHDTRGSAILNNIFHSYVPYVGDIERQTKGAIISQTDGLITSYALEALESRGILFVEPGQMTYCGMVIGEHSREGDCDCNPTKLKVLSNMRTTVKEDKVRLTPPKRMTLEDMIAYVHEDEVIEVTTKNVRLRKKILDFNERKRIEKSRANRAKEQQTKRASAFA